MVISTEIIQSVMIPLLVAFAISVALSPFVIPFLRRLKVGQTERVEGVQSHLKKAARNFRLYFVALYCSKTGRVLAY